MNRMSVLLTRDVEHVGKKGEVALVNMGFARNYLMPKGYALFAHKNVVDKQKKLQAERREEGIREREKSLKAAAVLQSHTWIMEVEVDINQHMHEVVEAKDILELFEREDIFLERKNLRLPKPLRKLGSYELILHLPEDVRTSCTVVLKGIDAQKRTRTSMPD